MGKSIYRILLCLVLGLGLLAGGSAQAAELEGPWHYYEFTGAPSRPPRILPGRMWKAGPSLIWNAGLSSSRAPTACSWQ